jgi:HAD superfamily hydrolase (TIGR01662 family)
LIHGVIFDLGMTLIQFTGDWSAVLEESWQSLAEYLLDEGHRFDKQEFVTAFRDRFETRIYERTADHIEQPTSEILHQVMSHLGQNDLPKDRAEMAMEHFYAVSEAYWIPKNGVKEVLDELDQEGYRLALISNAGDVPNVRRLLDKGNFKHYFNPLLVSAAEGIRKPHVGIFQKVIKAWNVPPEQIVMVGDNLMEDILGAQRAGIHQIWMKEHVDTPENHDVAQQIQPEAIAANFQEIPTLIREIGGEGR